MYFPKKITCLSFLILFFVTNSLFATINRASALEKKLDKAKGIEKIRILDSLSMFYLRESPEKSIKFSEETIKNSKELGNKYYEAKALKNLADCYYLMRNYSKSIYYYKLSLNIYKELNNKKETGYLQLDFGMAYKQAGDYHKAILHFSESAKIRKELNDKTGESKAYNNLGNTYQDMSNYNTALMYYNKSLKIKEGLGDKEGMANTYTNIGIVYKEWGNYAKALEYQQNALIIYEQLNDKSSEANCMMNIGIIYKNLGIYDIALEYFNKSLIVFKEINNKVQIAKVYNNIGNVYNKLKDNKSALHYFNNSLKIFEALNDKKNISKALNNIGNAYKYNGEINKAMEYYKASLKIKIEINDRKGKGINYLNIGDILYERKNIDSAMIYLTKAINIAEEEHLLDILMDAYSIMAEIYSHSKNYQKSLKYQILFHQVRDSILNIESRNQIAEMQYKYEMEKAEKENEFLKKNNALQITIKTYLIITCLIILILTIIPFRLYRLKHKANKLLLEQNKLITDQKEELAQMYDSLTESEVMFRSIFTESAIGMEIYDSGKEIDELIEINKACIEIFGLIEPSKIIGFNIFNNPNFSDEIIDQIRKGRKVKNEIIYDFDIIKEQNLFKTAKRGKLWVELTVTPLLFGENGKVNRYILQFQDISLRKKEEESIKNKSKFLEITSSLFPRFVSLDNLDDAINITLKEIGRFCGAENSYLLLFNENRTEVVNSYVWFYDENNQKDCPLKKGYMKYTPWLMSKIFSGEIIRVKNLNELPEEAANEKKLLMEKQAKPFIIIPIKVSGIVVGVLSFNNILHNDLWDENLSIQLLLTSEVIGSAIQRKQNEEALRRSEEKQRELNATKDKFFSIIAHDLINPLNAFMGISKYLSDSFGSLGVEEIKECIFDINKSATHLYNLIDNLLQWSRAQTGRIAFNPEKNDLSMIVDNDFYILKINADKKKISLISEINENTSIFADVNMLSTVIRNLISNAIKFTNEGGEIRLSARELDGFTEITVTDNGVGIKTENLDKLFRIDIQHTTHGTLEEKGTGLGLILCKEFIERHGGSIRVESEAGRGSRFIISMPTKE